MTKPLIQIGNEVREMTDEEIQSILDEREAEVARVAAEAEAKAAAEVAKVAAQEKLTALGLTVEDLQALGL